jgi:hypothetical protein
MSLHCAIAHYVVSRVHGRLRAIVREAEFQSILELYILMYLALQHGIGRLAQWQGA